MKHILENLILTQKIDSITKEHMNDPQLANEVPVHVPLTSMFMDEAHTQERRVRVFTSTLTAFVAHTAPALQSYSPENIKKAISTAFKEARNILKQIEDQISDDASFQSIVQRHFEADYSEQSSTVSNELFDNEHPLVAIFEKAFSEATESELDSNAVRPLH